MPVAECGACNGTGTCSRCAGVGKIKEHYHVPAGKMSSNWDCDNCHGSGREVGNWVWWKEKACKKCGGTGKIQKVSDTQGYDTWHWIYCPRCKGSCECTGCRGSGWVRYSEG